MVANGKTPAGDLNGHLSCAAHRRRSTRGWRPSRPTQHPSVSALPAPSRGSMRRSSCTTIPDVWHRRRSRDHRRRSHSLSENTALRTAGSAILHAGLRLDQPTLASVPDALTGDEGGKMASTPVDAPEHAERTLYFTGTIRTSATMEARPQPCRHCATCHVAALLRRSPRHRAGLDRLGAARRRGRHRAMPVNVFCTGQRSCGSD